MAGFGEQFIESGHFHLGLSVQARRASFPSLGSDSSKVRARCAGLIVLGSTSNAFISNPAGIYFGFFREWISQRLPARIFGIAARAAASPAAINSLVLSKSSQRKSLTIRFNDDVGRASPLQVRMALQIWRKKGRLRPRCWTASGCLADFQKNGDYDVRPELARRVDWDRRGQESVHEHAAVDFDWNEHSRDTRKRLEERAQLPVGEINRLSRGEIGRRNRQRNSQILKRAHAEKFARVVFQFLVRGQSQPGKFPIAEVLESSGLGLAVISGMVWPLA